MTMIDEPDQDAKGQIVIGNSSRLSLSIIMPAHNEARTIAAAISDILKLEIDFPLQLVVVDDGSTDSTPLQAAQFSDPRLFVSRHPANLGKGAAVLTGVALARSTHMVVFDADREYLATDLVRMFAAIQDGKAEVVYGTRIFGNNTVYQSFRYAMGNRITTLAANILFDSCLTDLHTCLKMMPVTLFRRLQLTEAGFGLDSEITGELLRRGYRPFEVPVHYISRSHAEGKKITWKDGVGCLRVLGQVRMRGKVPKTIVDIRETGTSIPLPVIECGLSNVMAEGLQPSEEGDLVFD